MWSARGYKCTADGPFGRFRLVLLLSSRRPDEVIVICLDGPCGIGIASPHRNGPEGSAFGHELCLYFPGDPEEARWVSGDGLVALADLARAHIWREFVWRTDGYWPGPEAPHGWPGAPE